MQLKYQIFDYEENEIKDIDLYWFEENHIKEINDTNIIKNINGNKFALRVFTEMQDCYRENIFSGDIINCFVDNATENKEIIGYVGFEYYSWSIICKNGDYYTFDELLDKNCIFKIIGNKYLNEDLM